MVEDVQLVLRLSLGADAPEGPGWYVFATNEAPLISPIKIGPPAAQIIAEAFERVVAGCATHGTIAATPTQIIGSGNRLVQQKLRQELAFAEAQAQRIKSLRQSLQALEESSGTLEEEPPQRQE